MVIKIQKETLAKALGTVIKAVPNKSTTPIMECVVIKATDNIKFIGNDTEMGIETTVEDAGILLRGEIAINAKILTELVKKLPEGEVCLETDDNYMATIKCKKSKFTIQGSSTAAYSFLPEITKGSEICTTQGELRDLIRQTIFCASTDNNMFSSVIFDCKNGTVRMSALDGHRIGTKVVELTSAEQMCKVLVPVKSLSEISRVLDDSDDKVAIFVTDKHILFEFGNNLILSRLADGSPFDIEKMLGAANGTTVKVDRKELAGSIERASLLIKETDKRPLVFNIIDGSISVEVTSVLGSMKEDIEIEKDGDDLKIGFNPKYLLEAFKSVDDDSITMKFTKDKNPMEIVGADYTYIILPISLNSHSN